MALALQGCSTYRFGKPSWQQQRYQAGGMGIHHVVAGDQLGQLALRYGVPLSQLAAANQLAPPYTIYVGQALMVPTGPPQHVAEALPGGRYGAPPDGPYVVQPGDNVSLIAKRLGVPLGALLRTNQIGPPYRIHVGQPLTVPGRTVPMAAMSDDEVEQEMAVRRDVIPVPARKSDAVPDAAAVAPTVPEMSSEGFLWPVRGRLLAAFGTKENGVRRDGINIAARAGTPVLAAEHGLVVYAGEGIRGYGHLVLLRHDQGYVTTYAHNATLLVKEGEQVERGQVIARVGSTGDVGRSQLHFELRKGREPIDPQTVLVDTGTDLASR